MRRSEQIRKAGERTVGRMVKEPWCICGDPLSDHKFREFTPEEMCYFMQGGYLPKKAYHCHSCAYNCLSFRPSNTWEWIKYKWLKIGK